MDNGDAEERVSQGMMHDGNVEKGSRADLRTLWVLRETKALDKGGDIGVPKPCPGSHLCCTRQLEC